MVEIDSNAILVEPMTSRKDKEMQRAYRTLMLRLKRSGIVPKKHVIDNEVSEQMKDMIRDEFKLELQLASPGMHRVCSRHPEHLESYHQLKDTSIHIRLDGSSIEA